MVAEASVPASCSFAHDGNRVATSIACELRELRARLEELGVDDPAVRRSLASLDASSKSFGGTFKRWSPSFKDHRTPWCNLAKVVFDVGTAGSSVSFYGSPDRAAEARVLVNEADAFALVLNVVANACRWSHGEAYDVPRGRRMVRTSIERRAEQDGPRIVLVVEDSGPGLPEGWTFDAPAHGDGIGLEIVREVAEEWGIRIAWGRSSELGGAKFEISFPAAADDA